MLPATYGNRTLPRKAYGKCGLLLNLIVIPAFIDTVLELAAKTTSLFLDRVRISSATAKLELMIKIIAGENVVPIPQEGLIGSSTMVNGVVMFGRGRNQCGVLIEPSSNNAIKPNDPTILAQFRNAVW